MINQIRYFGRYVDPAPFGRGFGIYSLAIRVLDWLRVRLERWTALLVLRCELKRAGATNAEVADVLAQAKKDAFFDPALYHEMTAKAPRSLFRDFLEEKIGTERYARYAEARKNTEEPSPYQRPIAFPTGAKVTFAGFLRKRNREARYAAGRSHQFIDADGDFLPLENIE